MRKNKRGISPVIATVLLISIVVVLGIIIFTWAIGIFQEGITKFDKKIEDSCSVLILQANLNEDNLEIINNDAQIPVYRVQINVESGEAKQPVQSDILNIAPGGTSTINLQDLGIDTATVDSITIYPVLLGTKDKSEEEFICENNEIAVSLT